MKPHQLGAWRTASGNTVDVAVTTELGPKYRELNAEWSRSPSEADLIEWAIRILPLATRRVAEYLEITGGVIVATP